MDKMPDRITDEVISNNPADMSDAVDKKYEIFLPIQADIIITVSAENEDDAKRKARLLWGMDNLFNVEYTELPEVEEL